MSGWPYACGHGPLLADVAIAVLVERGRSGGSAAAPLAARLFTARER